MDLRPSAQVVQPPPPETAATARVGLCASCEHAEIIISSKSSTFYRCRLADTDERFRKYPVLPVRACSGYHA